MKVQGQNEVAMCADGKFFVKNGVNEKGDDVWRQIELYLPCAEGTFGESIVATMERWLKELEECERDFKWAVGSTGGQLTARYEIRASDGELVSQLALNGGMKS